MFETSQINSNPKRLILSYAGVVGSLVLFVYMLPTILFSMFGGFTLFFPREAYAFRSPDDRFEIKVERRVNFPADSVFSPSGTVQLTLVNSVKNSEINQVEFFVHEYSEVISPTIFWNSDEVLIENIEWHKDVSIRFRLPELE